MALQWMKLGGATAAEAVMALLLTVRYPAALRRRLLVIVSSLLQPALGIVPFAAFQLLGTNMPRRYAFSHLNPKALIHPCFYKYSEHFSFSHSSFVYSLILNQPILFASQNQYSVCPLSFFFCNLYLKM